MIKPKKILILGSGGLSIGQAGEFDYSGSQAIKAFKDEGIQTVLINPNVATIQTTPGLADKIYLLPITADVVIEVIKKERPDALTASFGGQVALNTAVELYRRKIFQKYNIAVLGTPIKSVIDTEDRARFVKRLNEIKVKTPKSMSVTSIEAAQGAAQRIGFPIMIRAGFALGGKGSKAVHNPEELDHAVSIALSTAPHILIEEYLGGWKEIEYEVMRDCADNCITICNMENLDPLGIHTGESIVVTPSQTLSNTEYHLLRSLSIKTIRHLGIVGECNIQFALHPKSLDYRVIEVNARLSRSSALASKASGYPIAFIAAKLALGKSLPDLPNSMSKKTTACFEPALDYVVVKMPRWDLKKFQFVSRHVGSEMKSVGEVMAIGRNFEEALQKACRMINTGMHGLVGNQLKFGNNLEEEIKHPTDLRIFAIAEGLRRGITPARIGALSGIDPWFVHKIHAIVTFEREIRRMLTKPLLHQKNKIRLDQKILRRGKQLGFSDRQIGEKLRVKAAVVRELRHHYGIRPVIKQIDTLAAEYPAQTNYLYLTYNGDKSDIASSHPEPDNSKKRSIMVLGGGPYSIGSSVEFDWCCVTAGTSLQNSGYPCIMVNSNPETVSTDYDMFEKLYFEELTLETLLEIYHAEAPLGIVVSMGGQMPNTLALPLSRSGVKILGTDPKNIDRAEDRHKFSALLDRLHVDQPQWKELVDLKQVKSFAGSVGYPVLVRPSYVLSGAAMRVATNGRQLERYLTSASVVSPDQPVVVSKFITHAKEIEVDAVAKAGRIVAYAISEHIENAGVHSGDATLVFPAQKLYIESIRRIKKITRQIAEALQINGPFNIQYLAKDNEIKVIECNLRASRTFPFISKVLNVNFIELATKVIVGEKVEALSKSVFDLDHVGVKAPQFSFTRLRGADPLLGVEMLSTGEVACIDHDFEAAFLKALHAADAHLPLPRSLKGLRIHLSISAYHKTDKLLVRLLRLGKLGVKFSVEPSMLKWFRTNHLNAQLLFPPSLASRRSGSNKKPLVTEWLAEKKIQLLVSSPNGDTPQGSADGFADDYKIRRQAVDYSISLITDFECALAYFDALHELAHKPFEITSLDEYT